MGKRASLFLTTLGAFFLKTWLFDKPVGRDMYGAVIWRRRHMSAFEHALDEGLRSRSARRALDVAREWWRQASFLAQDLSK